MVNPMPSKCDHVFNDDAYEISRSQCQRRKSGDPPTAAGTTMPPTAAGTERSGSAMVSNRWVVQLSLQKNNQKRNAGQMPDKNDDVRTTLLSFCIPKHKLGQIGISPTIVGNKSFVDLAIETLWNALKIQLCQTCNGPLFAFRSNNGEWVARWVPFGKTTPPNEIEICSTHWQIRVNKKTNLGMIVVTHHQSIYQAIAHACWLPGHEHRGFAQCKR